MRFIKIFLIVVSVITIPLIMFFGTSAETFYTWDVYDDLNLDQDYSILSSQNVEISTQDLYTSILSDLQDNYAEYGVEKYEFIYYFSCSSGSGSIRSPQLRFGTNSWVSSDDYSTDAVSLNSSNLNTGVLPLVFTISPSEISLSKPYIRFYVRTTDGIDFTLTGITCKVVRSSPPSDIRILENIDYNISLVLYVGVFIVSLIVCLTIVRGLKWIFSSF